MEDRKINTLGYGFAIVTPKIFEQCRKEKQIKDKKMISYFSKDNDAFYEFISKGAFIPIHHLKPDYAEAYNSMGEDYYYHSEYRSGYDKAIECYKKAIGSKPDFAQPYYNMGLICDDKGNFDEAIKYYEKAVELKTDDADMYYYLGSAYGKKGNYKKAIECYEKVIKLKSEMEGEMAYYSMKIAYEALGNKDKANECQKNLERLRKKYPTPVIY